MINLLKETVKAIKHSGHNFDDIKFIGSETSGYLCTWKEFSVLADFEYDNGFGGQEVASDLTIVFTDDTKLYRYEYDGSERWEYMPSFRMPKSVKKIHRLHAPKAWWRTLLNINEKEEKQ